MQMHVMYWWSFGATLSESNEDLGYAKIGKPRKNDFLFHCSFLRHIRVTIDNSDNCSMGVWSMDDWSMGDAEDPCFESLRQSETKRILQEVSKYWYTQHTEGDCCFRVPIGNETVVSIAVKCTRNSPYREGSFITTEALLFIRGEMAPDAGYGNEMFVEGSSPSDERNIAEILAFLETTREKAHAALSHGTDCPE